MLTVADAHALADQLLEDARYGMERTWREAAEKIPEVQESLRYLAEVALRAEAGFNVDSEVAHVRAQVMNWTWEAASAIRGRLIVVAGRLAERAYKGLVDVAVALLWQAFAAVLNRAFCEVTA